MCGYGFGSTVKALKELLEIEVGRSPLSRGIFDEPNVCWNRAKRDLERRRAAS